MRSQVSRNAGLPKSIPHRLMLGFMITTLLAPVTILNKLLFGCLLAWTLVLLLRVREPRPRLVMPAFLVVVIFLYGFLLSKITSADKDIALQLFLSSFILIIIHFVEYFEINMDHFVELCGRIMIGVTFLYWLCFLYPGWPFSVYFVDLLQEINQSATAERDYFGGDVYQTLALSTVSFLFIPWCLVMIRIAKEFRWSDLLWLFLYGATIVASGRRGTATIAILFSAYVLILRGSTLTRLIFFIFFVALAGLVMPEIIGNTLLLDAGEVSNQVKIGHFASFIDQLGWVNAFFGDGLGSSYYSTGSGAWKSFTELTPIDVARYVGIPLAVALFGLLLFPIIFRSPLKLGREAIFISFALYLVLSVTNPVLINSYGMLVVLWYWSKYRRSIYKTEDVGASKRGAPSPIVQVV